MIASKQNVFEIKYVIVFQRERLFFLYLKTTVVNYLKLHPNTRKLIVLVA